MATDDADTGSSTTSGAGSTSQRPRPPGSKPWAEFVGRFMAGHLLAYPLGFVTAVATIPVALKVRERALFAPPEPSSSLVKDATAGMSVTAYELAQLEVILRFVGAVTIVVMLAVHAGAIPWAAGWARVAGARRDGADLPSALETAARGGKIFRWTLGTLVAVVVLVGTVSWVWLLTL